MLTRKAGTALDRQEAFDADYSFWWQEVPSSSAFATPSSSLSPSRASSVASGHRGSETAVAASEPTAVQSALARSPSRRLLTLEDVLKGGKETHMHVSSWATVIELLSLELSCMRLCLMPCSVTGNCLETACKLQHSNSQREFLYIVAPPPPLSTPQ